MLIGSIEKQKKNGSSHHRTESDIVGESLLLIDLLYWDYNAKAFFATDTGTASILNLCYTALLCSALVCPTQLCFALSCTALHFT
ncbi:hypothetical protein BX661DRAFT_24933 [Kickxella alabastrina]|uniref:uncharacterized protein n=1 Tax=Kickxella alabastrina TaxID=61397 RepID=UPI0022203C7C|nr:uncharacterized protein BX661DRAFT_24933 [Kickxella alabastrina]KAI7827252.1 hypothetical protein BX661DRAFT_24933 [Kickxella alabastrina]